MGRISINKSDDWHVEHDRQDIRGWEVQDASGKKVGRVRDLIANTDSGLVEAIVLDNNEEHPASTIDIGYGDKIVHLASTHAAEHVKERPESAPQAYGDARIREWKHGEGKGFARTEPSFRAHYRETYGDSDREYGDYHGAYRMGYDYGIDERYKGREWDAVEGDLRKDYERRHGERTWDRGKEAARYAFTQARSATSTAPPSTGKSTRSSESGSS